MTNMDKKVYDLFSDIVLTYCNDESKNIVKVNTNNFSDDELKMIDSNILKKFKVYDDRYTIYRDTLDYYNYIVIEKVVF